MTPHVIGSIVVQQFGAYWILRESIQYVSDLMTVYVPRGFCTDFASTPAILWPIFPPTDSQYSAGAIVHDRLYENHATSRRTADRVLYEAALMGGTSRSGAWTMWLGVRAGGHSSYATGPSRQKERLKEYDRQALTSHVPPLS